MSFLCRHLFAIVIASLASVALADDITTTAGKKLAGKLVAIDAQGATIVAGEARAAVSGKDIVVIDLGNKIAPLPKDQRLNEIELTDGSTIRGGKFVIKGRKVEAELLTVPANVPGPSIEIPLEAVFSIMRGAEDTKNREAWKKILGNRGKRDLYVMREPEGLNFVQGTILSGDETGTKLNFERAGKEGEKEVLLLRAASGGLVFSQPAPAQVPQTLCRVLDVFGNSLVAQSVQLSVEGVAVTTVSGVVVKYGSTAAIAKFDYAQGNVAYLSDLSPQVDSPEVPPDEKGLRLNPIAPYVRDHGVSGEPIKFGGETFPKGFVVAPDTVLTFNIGGDYREFKALLGLPENTPDANLEARVTIEADGNRVFSETLKRKDKPRPLAIDMKGVKQLRVIVEADLPVNGNRVIFADARVQK
ncbi:MAG: NPCBM/NEW2 domain-containing protein [Planctomycetes bacterium]|nr:NPCBM/NEW2 domain-containing protein [Planctomycetota bacterium]